MERPNYARFFGLKDHPFRLTPETRYFFPSRSHQQALEVLSFGIENGEGFLVLVGEPGSGKTMLLRLLLKRLPKNLETAILLTTNLSPREIIEAVLEDLGLEPPAKASKEGLWRLFRDHLLSLAEEGRRLLLVIDEAQNLPEESLEELRLLSNLEGEDRKLLQILLAGQPPLAQKLLSSDLAQLFQRITIWQEIRGLEREELPAYLNYRLTKAGGLPLSLEKRALDLLYGLSHGLPRLINKIMDRTLLLMAAEEERSLRAAFIKEAWETFGPQKSSRWEGLLKKVPWFYLHYAWLPFG